MFKAIEDSRTQKIRSCISHGLEKPKVSGLQYIINYDDLKGLPVISPPGNLATNYLATKEPPRHQPLE